MLSHDDSSASGGGLSDGRFVSTTSVAGNGLLSLHPPHQHPHQHPHHHLGPPPSRNMATWQTHQTHQQHHLDMTSSSSVGASAWGDVIGTSSLRGGSAVMSRDTTNTNNSGSGDGLTLAADISSSSSSTLTTTSSSKKAKKVSKKDVFICSEVHCGKQFPRSFALRRHQRIHTGNKPYACDEDGCTQRFNTSGNLSRHKRIHSGERPYPCIFATCGKRFNTSTKLKRHMRIHFPDGQNLFRCIGVNCSWSCDNYKEFAQHQKLHHGIIVGAGQQSQPYASAQSAAAAASVIMPTGLADQENDASLRNSAVKSDPDYFLADHQSHHHASRHEYDHSASSHSSYQQSQSQHASSSSSSSNFLYSAFSDKSKTANGGGGGPSPALGPRKLLGPPFFGSSSSDMSLSLFTKEPKRSADALDQTYSLEPRHHHHRSSSSSSSSKSAIAGHSAFPLSESPVVGLPQYHHSRSSSYDTPSFSLSSDSSYARSSTSVFGTSHYGGHVRSGTSSDGNEDYDQQQHQSSHSSSSGHHQHQSSSLPQQQHHHLPTHHVLRPPPQHDDSMKFGGFSVPPPMNPAAPEFTGEELSVVLELMKDSYC